MDAVFEKGGVGKKRSLECLGKMKWGEQKGKN